MYKNIIPTLASALNGGFAPDEQSFMDAMVPENLDTTLDLLFQETSFDMLTWKVTAPAAADVCPLPANPSIDPLFPATMTCEASQLYRNPQQNEIQQ